MWVFEEMVNGRKLTEIINTEHENVKYLPGHKLPANVVRNCGFLQPVFYCPHSALSLLYVHPTVSMYVDMLSFVFAFGALNSFSYHSVCNMFIFS